LANTTISWTLQEIVKFFCPISCTSLEESPRIVFPLGRKYYQTDKYDLSIWELSQ